VPLAEGTFSKPEEWEKKKEKHETQGSGEHQKEDQQAYVRLFGFPRLEERAP